MITSFWERLSVLHQANGARSERLCRNNQQHYKKEWWCFDTLDTGIDCSGPYCIPVPKAILAVGNNLSKRWLGTTVEGIIETWVGHSSTDSVFLSVGLGGGGRGCVGSDTLLQSLHIAKWHGTLECCVLVRLNVFKGISCYRTAASWLGVRMQHGGSNLDRTFWPRLSPCFVPKTPCVSWIPTWIMFHLC